MHDYTGMVQAAVALFMVFLAGLIRGFAGFGFSLAAVPLLSLLYPPARIVPVVMLLQVAISLHGLRTAWGLADGGTLVWLGLGALIATPFGIVGLAHLPAAPVRLVIAAVVVLGVVTLARGQRMARRPGSATTLAFGLASGLFNGLAGIPGPPVITLYLASPLPAITARASMIVLFLVTSVGALVPLTIVGMVRVPTLAAAALGLPAVWCGSSLGAWLFRRAPDVHYRRIALVLLTVTAILAAGRVLVASSPNSAPRRD